MKVFQWLHGEIRAGVSLVKDERLGPVIFLGEEGRGRRYEKIALDRRNPAEIVDGVVLEANPKKITLPTRDGKPEKVFYVLERQNSVSESVLVRVNTQWCYTRNSQGTWETVSGSPETLISGYGAHGDAGRIGNWNDGLIVMRPGETLKISPEGGHKTANYALWIGKDGVPQTATWEDYETLMAIERS